MATPRSSAGARLLQGLACLLVVKTTAAILANYPGYLPADFTTGFLFGREGYFFGAYAVAFYTHIAAGPFCLLSGVVLLSERLRRRSPAWHGRLGRAHVAAVLLLLTPSGLWMAAYAAVGPVAGAGFACLSLATAAAAALGARAAIQRRFADHRRWMQRLFALLSSAVVLRVIGGAAEVLDLTGTYPVAAWASWLLPLAALELARLSSRPGRSPRRPSASAAT
ncbi:MAG: DUF2306 domain-containing protein [Planctomycetota bacterium]